MDIFDIAAKSPKFSAYLNAWMAEATPQTFAWLDGYLASLHDAGEISADQRVAFTTMLSMTGSRGAGRQ